MRARREGGEDEHGWGDAAKRARATLHCGGRFLSDETAWVRAGNRLRCRTTGPRPWAPSLARSGANAAASLGR